MAPETMTWHAHAERAHAYMQRAIAVLETSAHQGGDLREVGDRTEEALGHLYDAYDGRSDALDACLAAQRAFREVADTIERRIQEKGALEDAVRAAREAASSLESVADAVAKLPAQAQGAAERQQVTVRDMRASVGVPRLHLQRRTSVVPRLRLPVAPTAQVRVEPSPLPKPTSYEELDTLAGRIATRAKAAVAGALSARALPAPVSPEPPTGARRFVDKWARDLFEEIAMLGMQRQPLLGDDWRAMADLEGRLLAALDAFIALGPDASAQLEQLALDAPVRDPARVFAVALVAGSVEGRDLLGIAERVLRDSAHDEAIVDAAGLALCLAPDPAIAEMTRSMLNDTNPLLRAMGAEVLDFDDALSDAEVLALVEDRPRIAAHAMLPLARRTAIADAQALVERSADAEHPVLRHRSCQALALLTRERALVRLRGATNDPIARRLLAMIGTDEDTSRLTQLAQSAPTPQRVDDLGWAGRRSTVPVLLALLSRGDEAIARAAAIALERITGAGLFDEQEIAPEQTMPRELPEPIPAIEEPPRPRLEELVADPRFASSEGSSDTLELPSVDPARWQAWWRERGEGLPQGRLRGGRAYGSTAVLAALDGGFFTAPERELLAWELELVSRKRVRFDARDWVANQRRALAAWAAEL